MESHDKKRRADRESQHRSQHGESNMLEIILWMFAIALVPLIVGILLGPIPTITDPPCSRPEPAPQPTLSYEVFDAGGRLVGHLRIEKDQRAA
jgi:hypothetical protein